MQPIFLGFLCNNGCVFCAQGTLRTSAPAPLPAALEESVAAALKESPGGALAFTGGEPTLYEGLPSLIRTAKRLGAGSVLVQTNARRLAYADYARELASAGADALDVSLQGSTAPMHDYHTGMPGSFTQTAAGLRNARAAGLRAGITTVVTRSNFRHLEEIVRLAKALGAEAVRMDPASSNGRARTAHARVVPAVDMVLAPIAAAGLLARSLGLGFQAFGRSSPPEAERLFAGLGEIEAAVPLPEAAPRPVPVPVKDGPPLARKRPAPGRREVHGPQKQSGEALKALFPGLFQEPSGSGR